jgi:hypothetical protein
VASSATAEITWAGRAIASGFLSRMRRGENAQPETAERQQRRGRLRTRSALPHRGRGPTRRRASSVGAPVILFTTDRGGEVYTVEGRPKGSWGQWSRVGSGIYTQPASFVTADWQAQARSFYVHLIDVSGVIYNCRGSAEGMASLRGHGDFQCTWSW